MLLLSIQMGLCGPRFGVMLRLIPIDQSGVWLVKSRISLPLDHGMLELRKTLHGPSIEAGVVGVGGGCG